MDFVVSVVSDYAGKPLSAVRAGWSTYMHISFMKNLSHRGSKSPESPCLSDMQSRLKRLMNSQVALQGLVWSGLGNPPHPQPKHAHISNTSACTRIKTRQHARPQWSTRQSNVSGICSCLVWRVFPTLPPSPGLTAEPAPTMVGKEAFMEDREGRGGLYSYWRKKDGGRERDRERERAWMIM